MRESRADFEEIKHAFEEQSGLRNLESELKERTGSNILIIRVANPTERLYEILNRVLYDFETESSEELLAILQKRPGQDLLQGPEAKLLLRTLAESQNINRYSFPNDFLSRYTRSVSGAEEQVIASANHTVFGRRGAGKSTLLLYAFHKRRESNRHSVWIDLQLYARRSDEALIADVILEILGQLSHILGDHEGYLSLNQSFRTTCRTLDSIRAELPSLKHLLTNLTAGGGELFIFLDDFHVVSEELQSRLLDVLYAVARGNRVYLKLSAIESLTRTYDPALKTGLQIPHDAQQILLDYNLTVPDKAAQHIEAILDSHAVYCGLPSIRRLCTSGDVLARLTWVAAGVPRDALSLFSQAMTKAAQEGRKHVSVSNINQAASEALNIKLRELEIDASDRTQSLQSLQNRIKDFCITENRVNAFLVEIQNDDDTYSQVRKLVDLRLLHVINEGITPNEAGRKFLALILDYGFYTGIRAARSVKLFNRDTGQYSYQDLRRLPVFRR